MAGQDAERRGRECGEMPRADADSGGDVELDAGSATENETPAVARWRPRLPAATGRRTRRT